MAELELGESVCVQQFEDLKQYILSSCCFLLLQKRREIVQESIIKIAGCDTAKIQGSMS